MEWEQRSIAARTFLLVKFSSFEKILVMALAQADIRTELGTDEPLRRMDGPVMEQDWVSEHMKALR
jgi:hypothetical protein